VQDAAHGSLLRSTPQQLHAQIAKALEAHSPELMDSQPELFAQHYAEAALVEKSVAYWGKAGRRSAARSAMAEAPMQLQNRCSPERVGRPAGCGDRRTGFPSLVWRGQPFAAGSRSKMTIWQKEYRSVQWCDRLPSCRVGNVHAS
jgi:hypothetical protein